MAHLGPLALREFPGPGGTHEFTGARGTLWGEVRPPESSKLRNCFAFHVLADRTPTGQKSRNTVFFSPLWPRTAFGTWRNSGQKTEKQNFPVLRSKIMPPARCARGDRQKAQRGATQGIHWTPTPAQVTAATDWLTQKGGGANAEMGPISVARGAGRRSQRVSLAPCPLSRQYPLFPPHP